VVNTIDTSMLSGTKTTKSDKFMQQIPTKKIFYYNINNGK